MHIEMDLRTWPFSGSFLYLDGANFIFRAAACN